MTEISIMTSYPSFVTFVAMPFRRRQTRRCAGVVYALTDFLFLPPTDAGGGRSFSQSFDAGVAGRRFARLCSATAFSRDALSVR